jgi:hypothetical protein
MGHFKELNLKVSQPIAGHTKAITNAMNEWGFICQDTLVGIGKSATIFKFKSRRGYVRDERLVLSNPHSS